MFYENWATAKVRGGRLKAGRLEVLNTIVFKIGPPCSRCRFLKGWLIRYQYNMTVNDVMYSAIWHSGEPAPQKVA